MSESVIERLYEIMKKIEENKKAGKHTENVPLFEEIVQNAKGDSRSKRLSSQFIARLFKEFPEKQMDAYDAMVDLAEDEDVMIRKQVISDLPKLCKDVPVYAPKVTDLLVQMMQTDDSQEHSLVNQSLMQALTAHPAEALTGLFDQLTHDEVADLTRERAIRFLTTKLPHLSLSSQQEELLVQLAERLLEDVSEEEFVGVVQFLSTLKCMRGAAGRQRLVDLVCQQADLGAAFTPGNPAAVARARECAKLVLAFVSKGTNARALVLYFLDKILPVIDQVSDETGERLDLLRCLSDLSSFGGASFVATDKQLNLLLLLLREIMPLPPSLPSTPKAADSVEASPPKPEEGEIETPTELELNFSMAECLLFAFHQLGRTNPHFLTACPDRLADFLKRLKHFNRANQVYLRSLRSMPAAQAAPPPPPPNKPEEEGSPVQEVPVPAAPLPAPVDTGLVRQTALVVTDNIARLIRDLLRDPPVYRLDLASLSWQPPQQRSKQLESEPATSYDRRKRQAGAYADNGDGYPKRRIDARDLRDRGYGGGSSRNNRRVGGGGGSGWRVW